MIVRHRHVLSQYTDSYMADQAAATYPKHTLPSALNIDTLSVCPASEEPGEGLTSGQVSLGDEDAKIGSAHSVSNSR